MCHAVHLNPCANFKQWYNTYEKKDVALPARASNKLRSDAIRLGTVYVCGDTHDEIMEAISSKE